MSEPYIVLLRKDLRVEDNPALAEAAQRGSVIPVYIYDTQDKLGSMHKLWLKRSLDSLRKKMPVSVYSGLTIDVVKRLVEANKAKAVYWNRCYEPWRRESDAKISEYLARAGIEHDSFQACLLWEPSNVLKSDDTYYKVFTPFYRKGCLSKPEPRKPIAAPKMKFAENKLQSNEPPLEPEPWHSKMDLQIGEDAAMRKLNHFLANGIKGYKEGRNFPYLQHTSELSPHIHFGEISPNQVWHAAKQAPDVPANDLDHFLSELGWREFSYNLLWHFDDLENKNFQPKFDKFPWKDNDRNLKLWQKGMTGYPIVDAGMRELWQTGLIHNRVRMIVASFLVKNLFIHWHRGRDWFWDCLADGDLASNSASWQWVAGCGADAAPYFRIFNPLLQSEKFDPEGIYIRKYIPELSLMPNKFIHAPWTADASTLSVAKVKLGVDYPNPIIDFPETRDKSLEYYKTLREG